MYTADLESALHYLLRVELATHNTLEGEELKIFKDFVTLVAKVRPKLQSFKGELHTFKHNGIQTRSVHMTGRGLTLPGFSGHLGSIKQQVSQNWDDVILLRFDIFQKQFRF